ncbi:MAG: hypothetical protein ABGX25_05820 [Nautiliaceae bacterium]
MVIAGILSFVFFGILTDVYKDYFDSKEISSSILDMELALEKISSNFRLRIKNSTIALKEDSGIKFEKLGNDFNKSGYFGIEYLKEDIYSKRGMWKEDINKTSFGYSGLLDLNLTEKNGSVYKVFLPFSDFESVKEIASKRAEFWGLEKEIFEKNYEVVVFAGKDGYGDIEEVNNSYGFYGTYAYKIFYIKKIEFNDITQNDILEIEALTHGKEKIYEKFFLVNGAWALVFEEGNLSFYFNYYPWLGEKFKDGNKALLIHNLSYFNFSVKNGVIVFNMCKKVLGKTVCRKKAVF